MPIINTGKGAEIVGYEFLDGIMANIHRVIKYTNLNYNEVMALPCDVFKLMLKNSIVTDLLATEEGRKSLEDYKLMNTTEPNIEGLSKRFNIKVKGA